MTSTKLQIERDKPVSAAEIEELTADRIRCIQATLLPMWKALNSRHYRWSSKPAFSNRNRKHLLTKILAAWLVATTPIAHAVILGGNQVKIDFTNAVDAETKATWSEPEKITVSKDGLGWDGEGAASRDGWIQTKPLALGLSWRPTYAITVRTTIHPPPREFTLKNGQKDTSDAGDVYVRYSPDLKHWSSWQVLQRAEPQSIEEKRNPGRHYRGTIRVPYRERDEYSKLVYEYSRLDVPWTSDEEAAVQWILNRDPEFFAKHIPFIGYAEFFAVANGYSL